MSTTNKDDLFALSPCPCCGSKQATIQYPIDKVYASSVSGIDLGERALGVAVCPRCGHEFIQPTPSAEFLAAYYANYMSQAKSGFYKERSTAQIPDRFQARYAPYLTHLKSLRGRDNPTLLDIGTGLGMFLRLAREYGFSAHGVEPNAEAATALEKNHGIPVTNCFFEQAEIDKKVDVITMWDLLEHLADPRAALKKSADLLEPGGFLVIEIPARDSFLHDLAKLFFRISGRRIRRPLYLVCGVHHLHYFSQSDISSLLRQCGFQVKKVYRGETELESLYRNTRGGHQIACLAHNLALRTIFMLARLLKRQNKLIVFAQKLPIS